MALLIVFYLQCSLLVLVLTYSSIYPFILILIHSSLYSQWSGIVLFEDSIVEYL